MPGALYTVDVEIWPTSLVLPKDYRLVLTLMGKDFEFEGIPGRLLHHHPEDRPATEFGGTNTIVTGGVARVLSAAAGHPAVARWRIAIGASHECECPPSLGGGG